MLIEKILDGHLLGGKATVQSIGVIYGMMIATVHPVEIVDWPRVHGKIRAAMLPTDDRQWFSKLDKIKKAGWDLHDSVARAELAVSK